MKRHQSKQRVVFDRRRFVWPYQIRSVMSFRVDWFES